MGRRVSIALIIILSVSLILPTAYAAQSQTRPTIKIINPSRSLPIKVY